MPLLDGFAPSAACNQEIGEKALELIGFGDGGHDGVLGRMANLKQTRKVKENVPSQGNK
jgi:hypothetical protein